VLRFLALQKPLSRVLLLAGLTLSACGTTSSSRATDAPIRTRPIRIRFVDWRSNLNLELVDQSHTDRAELYSSKRSLAEAGTKVTTDEVLEETILFFGEAGFFNHALEGAANSGSGAAQAMEIETPDGIVHLELGPSTAADVGKIFRTCRDNFAALYNNVFQLQSVDEVPDWDAQNENSAKKLGLTPPPQQGGKRP
jgi:hypothetical protein